MNEGNQVICVSESFPEWKTTSEDKSRIGTIPNLHPTKGEILTVDEVLGEFLRFDKYDTDESVNWWHQSRFRLVEDIDDEASIEAIVHKHTKNFMALIGKT